jgi:hypothetical protein
MRPLFTLALFMARVGLADDTQDPLALDQLAMFADAPDRTANFHLILRSRLLPLV